jgi:hypothetical protein
MKIQEGNILNNTNGIILHQVNCQGIMGGGLALQIKNKYPKVYEEYINFIDSFADPKKLLGEAQMVFVDNGLYIGNIFSQFDISCIERQTDYNAVELGFKKVVKFNSNINLPIYIPYLYGCGLGGGDWSIVSDIIEKILPTATICKLK